MRELLRELVDAVNRERPVVYCRLVETRGSTPQKAGAAMLVYADGSQTGTLGGGCVEAEVKRRALRILDEGQAEVIAFQLDSDYGWDDGLICGGRMQILVDPLCDATAKAYFGRLCELAEQGSGWCEAIAFDSEKCELSVPSSFLFDGDDRMVMRHDRTLGESQPTDCAVETDAAETILEHLKPLADRPRPYASHGVAYLPTLPRCRLLIVGGGHVGQAVGNMAADLDVDVWVVDDREQFASRDRFPKAQQLICGPMERELQDVEITPDTYCLIVTRGHNHDELALHRLIDRGARYIGLIGSKRKIKLIFGDLRNEGISAESLASVYAPVGIDIGSQTVPEIAVSILAELIAHRNLGSVAEIRSKEIGMGSKEQ